jgi:hypothetical protein
MVMAPITVRVQEHVLRAGLREAEDQKQRDRE